MGDAGVRFIGRYAVYGELASGGMATVHFGRLLGPIGFARAVAIKRLHRQYAQDPQFVAMFLDEARLASRIRHQNVLPTLDVVALKGELSLVMEYVHGESLSRLLSAQIARGERVPPAIAVGIAVGTLHGLHAAHEATDERGQALHLVHRDVSPQNVLVGTDGLPRLSDFGIAKAIGRLQTTGVGAIKGKFRYMSPEHARGEKVDKRADIWSAAVVLWEMLAGRMLFEADSAGAQVAMVLKANIERPSKIAGAPPELDAIVMRGLSRDRNQRFETAREMAVALEGALAPASARAIGDWVSATAAETLKVREGLLREMESSGAASPSSAESVRKQLVRLGFEVDGTERPVEAAPERSPAAVLETPTEPAPGRVGQSEAPPPPEEPVAQPPRRVAPGRLVAFLFAASVFGLLVVLLRTRAPAPAETNPTTPPLRSAASATITEPSSPPPSTERDTPPPPSSSGASTAAPPRPSSAAIAPRPSSSALPSSSTSDCDPPYVVGPPPDFIRRPKLHCVPP